MKQKLAESIMSRLNEIGIYEPDNLDQDILLLVSEWLKHGGVLVVQRKENIIKRVDVFLPPKE